ncbi:MAG: hypothetical protein QOG20_4414 [Pseudonocardiales bacterium]|nr:hypothetical protein [Pseudonocardiales bacterium]
MARSPRRKRARGGVEELPSGALRAYAYAGMTPSPARSTTSARSSPPALARRLRRTRHYGGCCPRSTSSATRRRTRRSTSCSTDISKRSTSLRARGRCTRSTWRSTSGRSLAGSKPGQSTSSPGLALHRAAPLPHPLHEEARARRPPDAAAAQMRRALPPARLQWPPVDDAPAHPLHHARRLREGRAVAMGGPQPDPLRRRAAGPTRSRQRRRRPHASSRRPGRTRTGECSSGSR